MVLNTGASSSTSMVIERAPQEWLPRFLQFDYYNGKCEKHKSKYKTVFCFECTEQEPICETCWKLSVKEHKDHPYLQVNSASSRAGVEARELKKYFDISLIQPYRINDKFLIYLKPNMNGGFYPRNNPECDICQRKLMESKYKLCSITCKIRSMEHMNENNIEIPLIASAPEPIPEPNPIPAEPEPPATKQKPVSFRKRSRKGIPIRAPLK